FDMPNTCGGKSQSFHSEGFCRCNWSGSGDLRHAVKSTVCRHRGERRRLEGGRPPRREPLECREHLR
ncbi:unnamed protein product, partial [Tetraodon nigroviridis]